MTGKLTIGYPTASEDLITHVVTALSVPREILADSDQISEVAIRLPKHLNKVPSPKRNELLARMCVAVMVGLFDAALNYAWNATIRDLRERVQKFGIAQVGELLARSFDEQELYSMPDARLLDLCLSLNLVTEEAFFFLDQNRTVRNNYSAAHPPDGQIDEDEFLSFFNRCVKYVLAHTDSPTGVDTKKLLGAIRAGEFDDEELEYWADRLSDTNPRQQEFLAPVLLGIYCDPASTQETRQNIVKLVKAAREALSAGTVSALVTRHGDYLEGTDAGRKKASRRFFEQIGEIGLLSDSERHRIFASAAKDLSEAHEGFNNFYTEPRFARRLLALRRNAAVPGSAQAGYVRAIVQSAIGNRYGVSNGAVPTYRELVKSFSEREISHMLTLPKTDDVVKHRVTTHSDCRERYRELVALLDPSTIPTKHKGEYGRWTKGSKGAKP